MNRRVDQMFNPVCTRPHGTPSSKGQQLLHARTGLSGAWRAQTGDQLKLEREIMLTVRIVAAICFGQSALALGGCQTTTSGGAGGAGRKQLMLVSSQELEQMAAQSYNKLKADAAGHGTLNTDGAMLQRVRAVAARLEPQTRTFRPDAPAWKWEVNVINSDELNCD